MAHWMLDLRDRVAQRVTADAEPGDGVRFVKVEAPSVKEAFDEAAARDRFAQRFENRLSSLKGR